MPVHAARQPFDIHESHVGPVWQVDKRRDVLAQVVIELLDQLIRSARPSTATRFRVGARVAEEERRFFVEHHASLPPPGDAIVAGGPPEHKSLTANCHVCSSGAPPSKNTRNRLRCASAAAWRGPSR